METAGADLSILIFLLWKTGLKNNIPQGGTYAVSFGGVIVMMKHMMLLYPFHQPAFEIIMVHGVMHHIVYQVAGNKTGKERIQEGFIGEHQ
jgi:hypothetical protein